MYGSFGRTTRKFRTIDEFMNQASKMLGKVSAGLDFFSRISFKTPATAKRTPQSAPWIKDVLNVFTFLRMKPLLASRIKPNRNLGRFDPSRFLSEHMRAIYEHPDWVKIPGNEVPPGEKERSRVSRKKIYFMTALF